LTEAARSGDTEAVGKLIAAGTDVNVTDAEKLTPLHHAAFGGHSAVVMLLLKSGADVNARDRFGFTPLHAAAREGHLTAVELLVEAGSDVNAKDAEGFDPAQVASYQKHDAVAEYLYSHGTVREAPEVAPPVSVAVPVAPEIPAVVLTGGNFRVWTSAAGATVDAEFVQCVMDTVVLRRRDGEQVRIRIHQLQAADQIAVRELESAAAPVLTRKRASRAEPARTRASLGSRIGEEKGWTALENCKLLRRSGNDGDSFHVSHDGKEYIFRLYYVDAPETSMDFPDRVEEQARYFDLDDSDTVQLGKDAAKFTHKILSAAPFTVVTKWEDARGNSRLTRQYAFVITDQGDLDELLAAEGLVRLYGMRIDGGFGSRKYSELKEIEREAKREKVGAWAKDQPATSASAR